MDLKYVTKTAKAPQVWESDEAFFIGFRGSSSIEKKDDNKGCFNCKKSSHFIVDCPEVQKDKSKKGSFINKFNKILLATWDELGNEEDSKKDKEQANFALMDLTSSEA
ncbi:hypothetical protein KIW84_040776 [Lathyrus oleraceus]|uniref:CCHC-type domain-containing protein n=1 Tax=Pisum sativum TaxID=3888 RepID=A0A9D4XB74_PEA|nr:hypothetical protein KIW84_040776 [Pisum sativum]